VYIDLFAGRGRYDDGTASTPLLILERAIADPRVRGVLFALLNDADPEAAKQLEREIARLPNIEQLRHPPEVYTSQVDSEIAELFQKTNMASTFAFIDPFGYKGLSRDLIAALVKDWASECAFFFNYNRISMGLRNLKVEKHMRAIFGDAWFDDLQSAVTGLSPANRERAILKALRTGLRELGGQHVVTFRFRRKNGRTSHYLIFVMKHELGCNVMRDVMAGMSSRKDADGVPSFEYDPRVGEDQTELDIREGGRLGKPKENLQKHGAGRTMTVRAIFNGHSHAATHCRPYVIANYKDALRQLEAEGKVAVVRPSSGRKMWRGKATMPDEAWLTFPLT
jgi:three-Cys-motif partner protein